MPNLKKIQAKDNFNLTNINITSQELAPGPIKET